MNEQEPKTKIIQVYNKKAKTTYLYEDIAYWDAELKQGRHKRKGIGKLDAKGRAVYNDYYLTKLERPADSDVALSVVSDTVLLGENLILDKMIADTGLKAVLSKTIGKETAELALQLVRYSVCEGNPLCYAEDWLDGRGFNGSALCSQRITDFLRSLDKDVQNTFYAGWIARKAEKKSLLFDISSISSYARGNPYVERGYNRDHEGLEQINIALISTYESNTPLWCTELPGSMSDQVALKYVFDLCLIKAFSLKVFILYQKQLKSRQYLYERYFEVKDTPKRGRKVILKEDEVDANISGHSGYWVLLSTNEKDTAKALFQYRQSNNIELHFDDMKNLMDCNRLQVHSEDVMQGRIFINFLTMIVVNELKRFIASIPAKDRNYWNHRIILHKVATYSRIHYRGKHKDVFSVPTKAQRLIFDLFDIKYEWRGKLVNDDGEVVSVNEEIMT